ncbi:MAG: pyruvate kinase alpha/beta domain-containing protein [Sciscionella sp.]
MPPVVTDEEMATQVQQALLSTGWCAYGDAVVVVSGTPSGAPGSTNTLRLWRVGDRIS